MADEIRDKLARVVANDAACRLVDLKTEHCFNVQASCRLEEHHRRVLRWLLSETFEPQNFGSTSFLQVRRPSTLTALSASPPLGQSPS